MRSGFQEQILLLPCLLGMRGILSHGNPVALPALVPIDRVIAFPVHFNFSTRHLPTSTFTYLVRLQLPALTSDMHFIPSDGPPWLNGITRSQAERRRRGGVFCVWKPTEWY